MIESQEQFSMRIKG